MGGGARNVDWRKKTRWNLSMLAEELVFNLVYSWECIGDGDEKGALCEYKSSRVV